MLEEGKVLEGQVHSKAARKKTKWKRKYVKDSSKHSGNGLLRNNFPVRLHTSSIQQMTDDRCLFKGILKKLK